MGARQWPRESKHVDYKKVSQAIQARLQHHRQRREAGGGPAHEEEKISNDTDKSNGLDQINEQLSALNKSNELDSGLGDTQKALIFNSPDDQVKSNRTNDADPIDFSQA